MKRASLNHAYRLVWNDRTQSFVAVAEICRSRGQRSGGVLSVLAASLLSLFTLSAVAVSPGALPTGGQITAGQGGIQQNGSSMVVNQATQNLIVNWQSFDIGSAASVRFAQPNAQAAVLNRVMSAGPSQIFGNLTANGRVYVVNPSGVVFGSTARVDTGGIVASTLQLSDRDFLAGKIDLTATPGAGAVTNLGELAAREGGFVSLVGASVDNAGRITAPGGQVALAAGESVRLDITDSGLVGVKVDGGTVAASVTNRGAIVADGGRVWMTARQASPLIATAINQVGTIRANTLNQRTGQIWLDGGTGRVNLSGTVLAKGLQSGSKGGTVVATGGQIDVNGHVNVSGAAGGGQAFIGGGWQGRDPAIAEAREVHLAAGASIEANATEAGKGGTVVLWSGKATTMKGAIAALGAGGGLGGRVETSSRGSLGVQGNTLVGFGGLWLLDPTNINVVSSGATGDDVNASSIEASLNSGGSVVLDATNDININSDIAKTSGAASTLTFKAGNNITLGSAGVSRKISASNDAATPTVTSSLNVIFQGNGVAAPTATGLVSIFGEISTNGGSVSFYKPTLLSNAKPVSTRVLSPNPSNPSASTTPDSGNVTFYKGVTLAGTSSVTIDTQSVQDSSQTYLRKGGSVEFMESITSLDPNSPRSLIINTTGAVSIQSGFPGSVGGTGNANYSGGVTFGGNVGTVANPLESLTIVGPSYVYLNAAEINLRKQAGDTMTFDAPGDYIPSLVLGQSDTTIRVTGFTAGSADYKQSTFDIVAGNGLSGTASLTIESDRSVQITGASDAPRVITGLKQDGSSTVALNVQLKPSQKASANSGAIALQNAAIRTFGGNIDLASSAQRAYGVASEQNADGIRIQSSTLDTRTGGVDDEIANDGSISVHGHAATSSTTGGVAVNLYGNTSLLADTGSIDVDGRVASTSGGANKDAVLIGNRGQATVTLGTTSGDIRILGDASAVGSSATVGASYNGVEISDAAMIRTKSGAIEVTGKGGGGNNNNVGENHGIRLKDTDTQIVSQTGNITLSGQTGGKTTSYGIVAAGADMALGQERATDTAKTVVAARTFTGNIDIVADTIDVVNNSSSRLRVMSTRNGSDLNTGQLNIRPLHDVAIQLGGTEATPPSSDNVAVPDKPLFLDSTWFAGSNAVFQPGFGEINLGRYGSTGVGITGGISESTKALTVAGATTVRDPLNLLMQGAGGQVVINAALNVAGASNAARTLNIQTHSGITGTSGTSLIAVDQLRMAGGGNMVLSGPNLVNTVTVANAAGANGQVAGDVQFNNAQALTVGEVTVTTLGQSQTSAGVTTQDKFATVSTTSGDLSIARDVQVGTSVASLKATAGSIKETGSAKVVASKLVVIARDDVSLHNANEVATLAASVTGAGKDLTFVGANGISLEAVTDGTSTTTTGLSVLGKAYLKANNGSIMQTARVTTGALAADATGLIDLSLPVTSGVGNSVGVFAARSTTGEVKLRNNAAFSVGTVTVNDLAETPTQRSLIGVETVANNQDITLATATGNLTLDQSVKAGTAGAATYANRGVVRLQASAGAVTQSASGSPVIQAEQLSVVARDTSSLNNANLVNELAASISGSAQGLSFQSAQSVRITEVLGKNDMQSNSLVGTVTGLNVPGDASLTAANGDITQTQDVMAGGLLVNALLGNVVLNRTTNAIGTLAARLDGSGSAIVVTDKDGLTVGTVASVAGVQTNNGQVTLGASSDGASTSGDLVVTQLISAGTATVGLSSGHGSVNETGSGQILASGLSVRALTASSLNNSANDVGTLSALIGQAGASLVYADANALSIGTVNSLSGVATNGGDVTLRLVGTSSTDSLQLDRSVSTGGTTAGTVFLSVAGGGVDAAAGEGVTASKLGVVAVKDVTLDGSNDVGTLAARVIDGKLSVAHGGLAAMTVGEVVATVPTSQTVTGVSASSHALLDSDAGLVLNRDVSSGGTLGLLATSGAVVQDAATSRISAATLMVDARDSVDLRSLQNHTDLLSARVTNGGFAYRDAASLVIGDAVANPGDWAQPSAVNLSGLSASGPIWVRTGRDLTLTSSVTSQAAGNQALVLAATRAFTNQAGATAVSAPNGRWLIYDDNSALVDRLGGLSYDFRRLETLYDSYPPGSVQELGNGYITTARLIDPDQAVRQVGGATPSGDSSNATLSLAIPGVDSAMGGDGLVLVLGSQGQTLGQMASGPAAFVGLDVGGAMPTVSSAPLLVNVTAGEPFNVALGDFVQSGRVSSSALSTGAALPSWLSVDVKSSRLIGRLPLAQTEPVDVVLQIQPQDLKAKALSLRLKLVPRAGDAKVAGITP